MGHDLFGVLSAPVEFELLGRFGVSPVDDHAAVMERLKAASDGGNHVILPDLCEVPRRGLVYHLPPTHRIEGDLVCGDEFRRGLGAFILGLFSILYECRLQWDGWWHEGYVKSLHYDRVNLLQHDFVPFFETAIQAWERMDGEAQMLYLQALAFHQKANGYAHGFEVFYADFTALEAIWHFGLRSGEWQPKNPAKPLQGHGKRLRTMALALGMLEHDEPACTNFKAPCEHHKCKAIRLLYKSRNELFHEAAWGERMGIMSGALVPPASWIHFFTKRVLIAALGFRNGFTRSTWESLCPVFSTWP